MEHGGLVGSDVGNMVERRKLNGLVPSIYKDGEKINCSS